MNMNVEHRRLSVRRIAPRLFWEGPLCVLLLAGLCHLLPLRAGAYDVIIFERDQVRAVRVQLSSWVFGRQLRTMEAARRNAEQSLQVQIDFVGLVGGLSKRQRQKLILAGEGDISRFFSDFDALLRATGEQRLSEAEYQQIRQKAQPYQQRFLDGLTSRNSLYGKAVKSTLTPEQLKRYELQIAERDRRHYLALVKGTVAIIERTVPLTEDQRQRLIDLVMANTKPPKSYGQSYFRFHVVLYQMSTLPEADLKAIFWENEWPVVSAMLDKGRGIRQQFERLGVKLDPVSKSDVP